MHLTSLEAVWRNVADYPRVDMNTGLKLRRVSGTGMEGIVWRSDDCLPGGAFSGYQNHFNTDTIDCLTHGNHHKLAARLRECSTSCNILN